MEARLEAADLAQRERQEVEEERALGLGPSEIIFP